MRADRRIILAVAATSTAILIASLLALMFGPGGLLPAHPTKCYDIVGAKISCVNTNQEEDVTGDRALDIYSRFTGIGTRGECTTDMLSGLMWLKGPDSERRTWHEAQQHITYMNRKKICGYDGWRLPERKELKSLISKNGADSETWLNNPVFNNIQPHWYWSSTTGAYYSYNAWVVNIKNGRVSYANKQSLHYVWPVRDAKSE